MSDCIHARTRTRTRMHMVFTLHARSSFSPYPPLNYPFDLGTRHAARSVGLGSPSRRQRRQRQLRNALSLLAFALLLPCPVALPALPASPRLAFAYFLACLACLFSCSSLARLTRIALRAQYTRRYFFSHSNQPYMHRLLSGHLHYCCYCRIYHPTTSCSRNPRLYIESFFALSQPNALVALACFFSAAFCFI